MSARKLHPENNSTKTGAHKYKIAFTKKCIFRIMGLMMDGWVVSYLLYSTCGTHHSVKGSASAFPRSAYTRCKRAERISVLAGTRLSLAFLKSLFEQGIFLNVLFGLLI